MGSKCVRVEKARMKLVCGHCEAVFVGTYYQAKHVVYDHSPTYCSAACKSAAMRKKLSTEVPDRGPCRYCHKPFRSRKNKQYCSMVCYMASDAFKLNQKKALQKAAAVNAEAHKNMPAGRKRAGKSKGFFSVELAGEYVNCLECGEEVYGKPSRPRKFCSHACYRLYLAKRFDRWVANPQQMALPQCYDEFLTQEELPCLIEGCDWVGQHLSVHANVAHGITARDFKRAAGFNLSTGLVSLPVHRRLVARAHSVEHLFPISEARKGTKGRLGDINSYRSNEGREHSKKSRALAGHGPQRHCLGCQRVFTQKTPFGRAKYCTPECRDNHYAEARRAATHKHRSRDALGRFLWT